VTAVLPLSRDNAETPPLLVSPRALVSPVGRLRPLASTARTRRRQAIWLVAVTDAAAATLASLMPSFATQGLPSVALVPVWLAALWVSGSYGVMSAPIWPDQARRVTVAGLGLVAVLPFAGMPDPGSPWSPVATASALVAAALITRQTARTLIALRTRGAVGTLRVVVCGHRREVQRIVTELGASHCPNYTVVAVCDAGPGASGAFQELCDVAASTSADAVLVAPCRHVGPESLRRLGWQLEKSRTQLLLATSLLDVAPTRTRLAYAGPLPLVSVSHPPLEGTRWRVKEAVDRILAAAGLLLLAPVMLAVVVLVRLDSPGAALFRQTRTGRNGVPFTMLKFRTMHCDAEERRAELSALLVGDSVLFKLRDDPRTTRVGRFLRRYSLDELPQLINVLLGNMALVGPRPPLPEEVARYHPDVRRRLAVKPGITGLWQVSGRSDLSWEESVRLDLRYVDNWSLGTDIGILARTLGAVVHHRGAY
jgi:exopolysaccharide biosynthesis polyprenyl glycosylphosphotransferase